MRVPVWYLQGPGSIPTPPQKVNCHNHCYGLGSKCHHKHTLSEMFGVLETFVKALDYSGSDPIRGLIP